MDTLELNIKLSPRQPWGEILIAELSDLGFDAFTESEEGIKAYAPAGIDIEEVLSQTSLAHPESFEYELEKNIIPYKNWNAEWEADFEPVYVEDLLTIRAPFHQDIEVRGMEVIIQPQMSFGTGHHQTTWLMAKFLFGMKMPGRVLDMGTGTGVLAIISEKKGAEHVLAIDIEEMSAENARENAILNKCENIHVRHGDIDLVTGRHFGLIIANINKNILKFHLPAYCTSLDPQGVILLSGFFRSDVPEMLNFSEALGLKMIEVLYRDEWAAMKLERTNKQQ